LIALVRYLISIIIWAVVAAVLLMTGKVVYLMFWAIIGALLVIIWFGHMVYKLFYLFNPDFKPIKIVLVFLVLIVAGAAYFKFFVAPTWNDWNSTREEIDDQYVADRYCPDADIRTVRTLEVNVPRDYIFRWIRQLPEFGSYGLEFFGIGKRWDFDKLKDDLPELKEGDNFLLGRVVDIESGKSVTFDIGQDPKFPKLGIKCLYGGYYLKDAGRNKTRINMVMRADYEGFWGWFYSQVIIECGDFLIVSRQLTGLKKAAEKKYNERS
jgi:hypothetical protein